MLFPLYPHLLLVLFANRKEGKCQVRCREWNGAECSRGVLCCCCCCCSTARCWQEGALFSLCQSLQCRWQSRLCLSNHTDRLKYWGCSCRNSKRWQLSFGKLVVVLFCDGFICSLRSFMLRLANVVTDVTDVSLAERQCFGSCTLH